MSDSEAASASDRSQSESDASQQESDRESDRESQQESDAEDDEDFDEEQSTEATAEPSAGKVKKPRLAWVTLKEWNLREQDKEEVMSEVEELARAEPVPFIPAGFLKSDPANSLGHWRQKSTVSEKKNNVMTTNFRYDNHAESQ